MVCPSCGTNFRPGDSFCYGCGATLPEHGVAQAEGAPDQLAMPPTGYVAAAPAPALEPAQESALPPPLVAGYVPPPVAAEMAQQIAPVRYAGFMVLALTIIVCTAIAVFLVVQGIFMHAGKEIYLRAVPLVLVAVVLAKLLADQSRQIKAHPEPRGFNNLLKASLCVALMFWSIAGLVGWQLGARRFAFNNMVKDWHRLTEVGNRISDQRNAAEDIDAQLEMYKAIQSDVADMQKTASRMVDEETQFADRYPEYREASDKEMPHIQVLLNRAQLLQREIEVARKISAQNEQQRALLWAQQMQPLLNEEAALDRNNSPQATANDD